MKPVDGFSGAAVQERGDFSLRRFVESVPTALVQGLIA